MWKTIADLGAFLCSPITNRLRAQAKEIKDNKVPISMKLLKELCAATDIQPYNAALSKALFLGAWRGYMRISEYSRTSGKNGNKRNIPCWPKFQCPPQTVKSDQTSFCFLERVYLIPVIIAIISAVMELNLPGAMSWIGMKRPTMNLVLAGHLSSISKIIIK